MNTRNILLFLLLLWTQRTFGTSNNYYIIDGAHEDNNVIKLWYTVLGLLDEYDRGGSAGFEITFDQDGKHFDAQRGPNWWLYYFAVNKIGSSEHAASKRLPRYKRSIIRFKTACTMSPERGSYLLKKYLPLQPALAQKVADIKQEYWPRNIPVVGIYYQNPIMPEVQKAWNPQELINYVNEKISGFGTCKICLFTDLEAFHEEFKHQFGSQCIFIQNLKNNKQTTPSERGEHDLLTLLLLAQCDLVIAPGSYQGIGAKILNQTLRLIELDTFPYARLI